MIVRFEGLARDPLRGATEAGPHPNAIIVLAASPTAAARRRAMAFAALALALPAACVEAGGPERAEVATDTGDAAVPIRLAGPGGAALLVDVAVNGQGPFPFVLDTGATLTCVDAVLADSLGLPEARGRIGIGAGVRGGAGAMRLIEIDSLRLGDARATGLTGCVVDLQQFRSMGLDARGLLGLDFLTAFRVTLDFHAERLLLSEP